MIKMSAYRARTRAVMPMRSVALVFLLAALLSLAGFGAGASVSSSGAATQATGKQTDKGDFKVFYRPVKNKERAQFQKELQEGKVLEAIVADLNSTIALPVDIGLTFTECGEANAFYDPEKRQISMCYELVEDLYESFSKHIKNQDALDDAVAGATIFIFYHELGHALIDVLDLTITGKEEDAVDQLSTFILTDGTDEGEKAALDGANSFYLGARQGETNIDELAFWDEHSLGMQRFYNIICLIYGQNEKKFAHLVKKQILPEDRAERCADEYAQVEKAWARLLAPHLKN